MSLFKKKKRRRQKKVLTAFLSERKKASRLVKQLRRKLEQTEDASETEALKRELHVAEVDEAYTLYHPHAEPYISLYGSTKTEEAEEEEETSKASTAKAALNAERPPMWSVVEKAMEEGKDALTRLRERRSPDGSQGDSSSSRRPSKPATARRTAATEESKQPRQSVNAQRTDKQSATNKQNGTKKAPQLNRRERRRLMRDTMATKDDSDEEGGFFEED